MGQLRDEMYEDLKLRGYRKKTTVEYLRWGRLFAAYRHRSPQEMGEPEVRAYLMHLLKEKRARPASHKMEVASLRFPYGVTLGRPEVAVRIPWPKVPHTLPEILSGKEVLALFAALPSTHARGEPLVSVTLCHRTIRAAQLLRVVRIACADGMRKVPSRVRTHPDLARWVSRTDSVPRPVTSARADIDGSEYSTA